MRSRTRVAASLASEGAQMIDAIAALWAQGKALSAIAEALGVSRGKVAGAIDRARKSGDSRFAPRPPLLRKKAPVVAQRAAVVAPRVGRELLVDLPRKDVAIRRARLPMAGICFAAGSWASVLQVGRCAACAR